MTGAIHQAPRIVCVGHSCRDIRYTVSHYPEEDGEARILSEDFSQGGGAAATAAVAAALLGCPAAFIGNTGTDETAYETLRELQDYGVDTRGVRQLEGAKGLYSVVLVNPRSGKRTKFPRADELPDISFDQEQRELIENARVLHLDGTRFENALRAAEIARAAGVEVSLDACIPYEETAQNRRLLSLCGIVITDRLYPSRVTGLPDLSEALQEISRWGRFRVLMTTAGEEGSYLYTPEGLKHFPAFPVTPADTTGCGDVFHGAFLTAWTEGRPLDVCVRFASVCAALKARAPGGRKGIPDREEAEKAVEGWRS